MANKKILNTKITRRSIVIEQAMYNDIIAYGQNRGCTSFSEAVRDLARIVLDLAKSQPKNNNATGVSNQRQKI